MSERPYQPVRVWVSSDHWPDSRTLRSFARDVVRLERPRTDEQKALALYRWVTRTILWGGQIREGPPGCWAVEQDLIKMLNVHGYGYCDGWGRLFSALWQSLGGEAYKTVVYNDGLVPAHTQSEIWYTDADGVRRPHAFDVFHQVAVRTRDASRICSFQDMFADKTLLTEPTEPVQPFYIRDDQRAAHANAKYIGYPLRSLNPLPTYDIRPSLRPGTELTRLWQPLGYPYHTDFPSLGSAGSRRCPSGLHDPYAAYLPDGAPREPDNEPLNRPYLRRCRHRQCKQYNQFVRFYANGRFRYRPPLNAWPALLAAAWEPSVTVQPGRNGVRPVRPLELATLIVPVECPYIFTHGLLRFRYTKAHPGDWVAINASTDAGKTWRQLYRAPARRPSRPAHVEIDLGAKPYERREVSIFGRYNLWLRFEMIAVETVAGLSISNIEFEGIFQHNPYLIPRLMPGENRWRVQSAPFDPRARISVELVWDDRAGKARRFVHRLRSASDQFVLKPRAAEPADVRMQALTIRCD
jgi:hypothetical protein